MGRLSDQPKVTFDIPHTKRRSHFVEQPAVPLTVRPPKPSIMIHTLKEAQVEESPTKRRRASLESASVSDSQELAMR